MGFGPSLYSQRLYSGNDYSQSPGTVLLSEAMSLADSAPPAAIGASLADTLSPADALQAFETALRALTDILTASDAIAAHAQPQLSDFILLNEFISVRLSRTVSGWTRSGASLGLVPRLYGTTLYAQHIYSTDLAILWKAIARSTGPGFTNQDGHKN